MTVNVMNRPDWILLCYWVERRSRLENHPKFSDIIFIANDLKHIAQQKFTQKTIDSFESFDCEPSF